MKLVRPTIFVSALLGVMLMASTLGSASLASAQSTSSYLIDYTVNATTTLAKLHETVMVPLDRVWLTAPAEKAPGWRQVTSRRDGLRGRGSR